MKNLSYVECMVTYSYMRVNLYLDLNCPNKYMYFPYQENRKET